MRSRSSSSEYDQSTVARSVWWRSTAVRRPPVRSRNRSSRRAAISRGLIATTRAAASSIASGIPSRRRQISATAAAFVVVEREARPGRAGRGRRTAHRVARATTSSASVASGHRRATAAATPARRRRRAPRGSSPGSRTSGHRASTRFGEPAAGVEQVLAVVEHEQQLLGARGTRRCSSSSDMPGARRHAERRRDDLRPSLVVVAHAASSQSHAPSGNRGSTSAATCSARRVLPTPPTPVSVTSRARRRARRRSPRSSCVAADERRRAARGRLPGNASSDRSGGNSPARPGRTTWNTRSGRARSRRRCSPRSTSSTPVGSSSRDELLGRERHHDLAAVRRRHQPRGAVHRGAVVVAVAQLGRRRCARPSARAAARSSPHGSAASARCASDRGVDRVVRASRTPRARRRRSSSRRGRRAPRPRRAGSRRGAPARACIASGCSSHRRVEPSRSVNRNVTVPVGSSVTTDRRAPTRSGELGSSMKRSTTTSS